MSGCIYRTTATSAKFDHLEPAEAALLNASCGTPERLRAFFVVLREVAVKREVEYLIQRDLHDRDARAMALNELRAAEVIDIDEDHFAVILPVLEGRNPLVAEDCEAGFRVVVAAGSRREAYAALRNSAPNPGHSRPTWATR